MTLRELRALRALSLAELAERAGVSESTVWEIEHNLRVPQPRTRRKLAEALGVDPSEIDWPERPHRPQYPRVTTCGYCGAVVAVDDAYDHLRTHLNVTQVVVDVANFTARLARHVPEGGGRVRVEYADPQPPARMLETAVTRAGGAINISGIYPVTPAIERWIARAAPRWLVPNELEGEE